MLEKVVCEFKLRTPLNKNGGKNEEQSGFYDRTQ
jgi:hypothetical protein